MTDRGTRTDLTIVIPTYNERDGLDVLLERIFAVADREGLKLELVIVDDNSADGTGDCAERWARGGRVRVIHRAGKLGLGSAVLDGFALASSEVVGVMDADMSHPPDLIPTLYRTMASKSLDMVVASRYVRRAGTRNWPIGRLLLSKLACWLARPLTPVRDATSGFFLIKRARLAGLRTSLRGFKIGLELLVRARPRSVAEVGYVFVGRRSGESKMTIGEGIGFLRQLAALYANGSPSTPRPGHFVIPAALDRQPSVPAVGRLRA